MNKNESYLDNIFDYKAINEPTNMLCPISGFRLMYVGSDYHVMDADSYYQSEFDPTIIYANHPFSRNVYRLIESRSIMAKTIRYFVLEEDNILKEYCSLLNGKLVPIETPVEEIEKANEEYKNSEILRKEEYEKKVASGEITPIYAKQIFCKTISPELISVKPMDYPKGIVFFNDYKVKKISFKERLYNKFYNFLYIITKLWPF